MKALNTHKRFLKLLFLTTILFFCVNFSFAQLTITATQAINFGTICLKGSNGTVTVGWDGSRTSAGNILLLSLAPVAQPAIFEIKLCPTAGTVNITYDASTILTGSHGGELTLELGPTDKGISGSSFTTNNDCNIVTLVHMGGTLNIPAAAQDGTYTGSFSVTVNQE